MRNRLILLGILLTVPGSTVSSASNHKDEQMAEKYSYGVSLGDSAEVMPGVTVKIESVTVGHNEHGALIDETYIVGTLDNQSGDDYQMSTKDAFFTVGDERIDPVLVTPFKPINPGFRGKVAWMFGRDKSEFKNAMLTIQGAKWRGNFADLPPTTSGAASPSSSESTPPTPSK